MSARRPPAPHLDGRLFRHDAFLSLAFLLLVLSLSLQRIVLLSRVTAYRPALQAVLLDAGVAITVALAALLLGRVHWAPAALFLAAVALLQVANNETVIAMDTVVSLSDLGQGLDGHFLRGSASRLSAPGYAALTLGSAALCAAALARGPRRGRLLPPARLLLPCLAAAVAALFLLAPRTGGWEASNPLLLTLTRPRAAPAAPSALPPPPAALDALPPAEGESLVRRAPGAARNVLLVVLEGIPGVYLRQVQEATGVSYPLVMPALSRIAEHGLVAPRFLTHNRQTVRGLYSLLSGDYPGLSLLTPKIYAYMRLPPESRRPCLPEILARAGYATAFLQAADLAYMSKDQFLPQAGFRQVLGREHFHSQYVPFGWGPDDRAFFEGAARFIEDLDRRQSPWLVTLLTVGTHHPYAVPDEWASRWPTRKEAAVAWLDAALEAFWRRLEEAGILEDTLVIFTSDESHGVTGQPFGRFWGLAVAVAPEGAPARAAGGGPLLQPGVFGLVDLPHSVLDYLGLAERTPVPGRRSLFRRQEAGRSLLFGPYALLEDGTVAEAADGGRVQTWAAAGGGPGGGPFAPAYTRRVLDGEEGLALAGRLRREQAAADGSLDPGPAQAGSGGSELVLLSDREFVLDRPGARVLSTGQYLAFPAGTLVTVSLQADVRADDLAGGAGSAGGAVRLSLLVNRENEPIGLPPLRIPALHEGEGLELSFSFRAEGPLDRVWAHLSARPEDGSPPVRVRVERFAVRTGEAAGTEVQRRPDGQDGRRAADDTEVQRRPDGGPAFRLHRLEVRPTEAPPDSRAALPPVAHAGGLYRGMSYTNSLEALEANSGAFTHFEIDFEWTRDRELVGLHDWDTVFRRLYGAAKGLPLTLEQLRVRAAARGLTLLDLPGLHGFLERHPRARIVTDVKSGNLAALERIASFFSGLPALLERFIPQVYHPGELEPVLRLGYRSVIWSLYRYPDGSDPQAVLAVLRDWKERLAARPFAVALPAVSAERGIAAALAAKAVPVYAHTVNDPGEAARLRRLGVSAVYTDEPHLEGG